MKIFKQSIPRDNLDYRYPVSVKGVIQSQGRFLLLNNERDEWELPGGKLELDETPEDCLVREIREETGLSVKVGTILDAWVYHITKNVYVSSLPMDVILNPFPKLFIAWNIKKPSFLP